MAKEYTDEDIDAYLRGQLPAEQARQFELKLEEDAGFAETVKVRKAEKRIGDWLVREEVFKDKEKWLEMAKAAEETSPDEKPPEGGNRNLLFWMLGLAMLIIAAFFLYRVSTPGEEEAEAPSAGPQASWQEQFLDKSATERLAYVPENLREAPPLGVSTKSGEVTALQEEAAGITAYQKGEYAGAIRILAAREQEGALPELAEEALAYSYYARGNYQQAIPRLEALRQQEGLEARNRASWYLLLSRLATYEENPAAFEQLLEELSRQEDNPYRPAVEALRRQLNPN